MAAGDILALDFYRLSLKLLDGQEATGAGPWMECPAWYSYRSVHMTVGGDEGGGPLIDIEFSNAETQPDAGTHGQVEMNIGVGSTGNASRNSYRWVRAFKTAGASPIPTTVIFEAHRRR